MKKILCHRSCFGAEMNKKSNKSHCICNINLLNVNHKTGKVSSNLFQFVDLAGSERKGKPDQDFQVRLSNPPNASL